MRNSLPDKVFSFRNLLIVNGILVLFYIMFLKPVIEGDAGAYINFARQIFSTEGATEYDFTHRSPLYPLLIGLIMKLSRVTVFLNTIVILQFILVFLVSVLIYNIFRIISGSRAVGFAAGLLSTLNLSTIYFAYNILTETLALFLFTALVQVILKYYQSNRIVFIAIAGLLTGLLILTRFNMMGLPIVIVVILILIHFTFTRTDSIFIILKTLIVYSVCTLIVTGAWSFYNLSKNDFFGVIPPYHKGQRWAIPAIIKQGTVVSEENQEIFEVFIKAKEELEAEVSPEMFKKGTLLQFQFISGLVKYFEPENNGFVLYTRAEPGLLALFDLQPNPASKIKLWDNLKPFYDEVAHQGSKDLLKLRVFSFLHTFKYVSPTHTSDHNNNLNKLPNLVIIAYKISFMIISIVVFVFSFLHSLYIIVKLKKESYNLLVLYSVLWYFPLVHFYANVLNDANRFKYPTESLMIGIFVFILFRLFRKQVI